jgi:hypothetical protein
VGSRPRSPSTGRTLGRLRIRPAIYARFDPDETRRHLRRDNGTAMNAIPLKLSPPLNRPVPAQRLDLAAAHGISWSVGIGALVWAILLFALLD